MECNVLNPYKQNVFSDILPIVNIAENHSMTIVEYLGLLFKCILSLIIFMDLKCPVFICYENLTRSNKKLSDRSLTEHKQKTKPQNHTHTHTHKVALLWLLSRFFDCHLGYLKWICRYSILVILVTFWG